MAIVRKISDFPGSKTFKAVYASLPGSPLVKNVLATVIGAGVAAVAVGVGVLVGSAAVGAVGLIAGAFTAFLGAGLLVKVGVILALAAIWKGVTSAIGFAYRFNWQISDKEIADAAKKSLDRLYQPVGQAAGKLIGFIGCGFVPGALAFAISPATSVLIMRNLAAKTQEEMRQEMANIATLAATSQGNARALQFYGSMRKWAKRPGTPQYDAVVRIIGKKRMDKWGVADAKPFIITNKIDDYIEDIKDKNVQGFFEGFKEGLEEGCEEATLTINAGISEQIAAMKLAAGVRGDGVLEVIF